MLPASEEGDSDVELVEDDSDVKLLEEAGGGDRVEEVDDHLCNIASLGEIQRGRIGTRGSLNQ